MSEEEKKAIEYFETREISFEIDGDIEKLKEALGIIEEDNFDKQVLRVKTLLNLIEKLQTKIDKAIEYIGIDEELEKCCDMYDVNGIDLLRILKGE